MTLENYRHYLQREFESRRVRNPSYSLRAFARDLETSPSRLSEAINGKRGISLDLARQMIKSLRLEGVDAEIFVLSVEAEHARSGQQRKLSQAKLKRLLEFSEEKPKTFTIVDWVAEALLKMNERESVGEDVEAAARKLNIPSFMAVKSMRFLTRLGFISDAKNFKTYLQSRGRGRKLNIDYTQILENAHKSYVSDFHGGHFHHEALLLEKKNLEKVSRILYKAFEDVRKLESRSKRARVFFVASQVFSVEKEGKKND